MKAIRFLFSAVAVFLVLLASYCASASKGVAAVVMGALATIFFWVALELAAFEAVIVGGNSNRIQASTTKAEGS